KIKSLDLPDSEGHSEIDICDNSVTITGMENKQILFSWFPADDDDENIDTIISRLSHIVEYTDILKEIIGIHVTRQDQDEERGTELNVVRRGDEFDYFLRATIETIEHRLIDTITSKGIHFEKGEFGFAFLISEITKDRELKFGWKFTSGTKELMAEKYPECEECQGQLSKNCEVKDVRVGGKAVCPWIRDNQNRIQDWIESQNLHQQMGPETYIEILEGEKANFQNEGMLSDLEEIGFKPMAISNYWKGEFRP
ncbi:unnamed protein product, partial [marine sediment metagenome]